MSTTQQTNQVGLSLEQQEDLRNKKYLLMGIGALVLFTILGALYGFMSQGSQRKLNVQSSEVYNFEKNVFKSFADKKIEAGELLSKMNGLLDKVDDSSTLLALNSKIFKELGNNKSAASALMAYTEKLLSKVSGGSFANYFYTRQLGVLYENSGEYKKAFNTFKNLESSNFKVANQLNLDLGRLSLLNNDKKAATDFFKKITKDSPDSEAAKLVNGYAIEHALDL